MKQYHIFRFIFSIQTHFLCRDRRAGRACGSPCVLSVKTTAEMHAVLCGLDTCPYGTQVKSQTHHSKWRHMFSYYSHRRLLQVHQTQTLLRFSVSPNNYLLVLFSFRLFPSGVATASGPPPPNSTLGLLICYI